MNSLAVQQPQAQASYSPSFVAGMILGSIMGPKEAMSLARHVATERGLGSAAEFYITRHIALHVTEGLQEKDAEYRRLQGRYDRARSEDTRDDLMGEMVRRSDELLAELLDSWGEKQYAAVIRASRPFAVNLAEEGRREWAREVGWR